MIGQRRNKYRAKAVRTAEGEWFASTHEYVVWRELQAREQAGNIRELRRQVPFDLTVNRTRVCHYIADFTYEDQDGPHVLDAKGVRTPVYRIKAQLMWACLGIRIEEV